MHSRSRLFLLTIAIAVFCSIIGSLAANAQASTSSLAPDISSLETRFFDHTYPQESTDDRLGRLERMVFGEAKTGSDQARLTALLTAVPEDPTASSSNSQTASAPSTSGLKPETASDAPVNSAPQNSAPTTTQYTDNSANYQQQPGDVAASSDYPRITQLEQEILGKTFANEPIQQRLEQLELKAFGKASATQDLSDRTDALESYADQHFPHQNYPATADGGYPSVAPSYNQAPAYGQQPAYSQTSYGSPAVNSPAVSPKATLDQKVTWLEKQVFNKTYLNEPLLDRVKRLATNIFPTDSPQMTQSLADQVSSMIGAVELNHPGASAGPAIAQAPQETLPPFSQPSYGQQSPQFNGASYPPYNQNYAQQNQAAPQPAPQQKTHSKSLLTGLAHVLGTVGSMAAGSMMGGYGGMGGMGMPFTW